MQEWNPSECAVFFKTRQQFGSLSNMATFLPFDPFDLGVTMPTSEHLFQIVKFDDVDVRRKILAEPNPVAAKMISREHNHLVIPEWERIRIDMMELTLRLKFNAHREHLLAVLTETGDRPIVERSSTDQFWGAVLDKETGMLVGENQLGKLWMKIRQQELGV